MPEEVIESTGTGKMYRFLEGTALGVLMLAAGGYLPSLSTRAPS